jgi:hypothetical protein
LTLIDGIRLIPSLKLLRLSRGLLDSTYVFSFEVIGTSKLTGRAGLFHEISIK